MNLNYTIIQVLEIITHVYSRPVGSKKKQKHIQRVLPKCQPLTYTTNTFSLVFVMF